MPTITVGFSLHRPEMVPCVAERMRQHAAIFLEEPGSPDFQRMLTGEIPIEDDLLPRYSSSYVEAGLMHYQLWRQLRRLLTPSSRVRPAFLAQAAWPSQGEGRNLYGPGDRLTLQYIFHPAASNPRWEELLAARSMIYSKILNKPEAEGDGRPFPHLRDELACIAAVRRLSLEDCRRWFPLIRRSGASEARRRLTDFIRKDSGQRFFERGPTRSVKAT